ncbi:nuclear transport factor 2 family protein [Novosphingobium malaysiense]|uniref:SnoaL-like domain-containing protein n=1 Tax=Novosphingobium malaysiense TaxID=1348853 RepID=A0A0B1ZUT6_9SPHN|nr:nuclear transport factor 2 family protein [Novosphingobium malaysiense]KHK92928.1 hypothetical protein LK12_00595 [Novosphingobium malaysiense]
MTLPQLEDRLAITDLVNRSVAGVLRKDLALWGGTWAEDGSWMIDMFDKPVTGREQIVAIFGNIVEKFAFVAMSSIVSDIAIDGDRATGKAYSQEFMFPKAGGQKILCGCFEDHYVRLDGRWYFQSRVYETLYRSTVIDPAG